MTATLRQILMQQPYASNPGNDAMRRSTSLSADKLVRVVHNDACVEVEGNWYSVPWKLLKQRVSVLLRDQQVLIRHGGRVVARHERVAANRRHRSVLRGHWDGLVPAPQQDLAERSLPSADGASCVGSASAASPPCGAERGGGPA